MDKEDKKGKKEKNDGWRKKQRGRENGKEDKKE